MTQEIDNNNEEFSINDLHYTPDHEARARSFLQDVLMLRDNGEAEVKANIIGEEEYVNSSDQDEELDAEVLGIDIDSLRMSEAETEHFFEINSVQRTPVRVNIHSDNRNTIERIVSEVDNLANQYDGIKSPDNEDITDRREVELPEHVKSLLPDSLAHAPRFIASLVYEFEAVD